MKKFFNLKSLEAKKLRSYEAGFTLIELLVVIAIIGILSSVVLVSLNQARNKGVDAAIKSEMANMRGQAEIYYDNKGNYSTAADCTLGIFVDIEGLKGSVANLTLKSSPSCSANSNNWAVSAALKSDSAKIWCVDNTGFGGTSTATSTSTAVASSVCVK